MEKGDPQELMTDYEIPPVTLLFNLGEAGLTEKNRAKLRETVLLYSPDLTNQEAGFVVTALTGRLRNRLSPWVQEIDGFEQHPGKGLTYLGGTGSEFLASLEDVASDGTALCMLDVYGNMTE
jgi:hypothetical protein